MNRFTCISSDKFSLNERRLVWQEVHHDAPDTPRPAIVAQENDRAKWEKTWAEGKKVPEGKPGVKGPDDAEAEKLVKNMKADKEKWDKEHPKSASQLAIENAYNQALGIVEPSEEDKAKKVASKKRE